MAEINYIIKVFYVNCFNNTWCKTGIWEPFLLQNIKGDMSDSVTNYNYVGNSKVSVSIKKKLMPTNAH